MTEWSVCRMRIGKWRMQAHDKCSRLTLYGGPLQDGCIREIFNVGDHNEMRNIDVVKLIRRKLEKLESLITFVTDQKGRGLRYAINLDKIHAKLDLKVVGVCGTCSGKSCYIFKLYGCGIINVVCCLFD